ncbi:MAG: RDD family protein [Flavobacteriales bacterium]|nr:RDD family protein [Flavobacteriales bacterium]
MSEIHIETAQNVVVKHEVANVGSRIAAYLLDGVILAAWIIVWFFLLVLASPDENVSILVGVVVIGIPYVFYHLICELTMDGKSIGKSVMKIKVARVDGGQPRVGQYLLRWLLRPVDGFYGLGLVVVLINGRGQRLGDLAAGTTVISLKQRMQLRDTLMTEVSTGHQVRFPEAVRLNDAQAAMIKEVLQNIQVGNRWQLVEEMADKVRRAIGNNGDGMKSTEFLRTVLKDYVYLTGQQGGR